LAFQGTVFEKRKFKDYFQLSLNWREGSEIIFIAAFYPSGFGIHGTSIYQSLGIGISNGISYKVHKRVSVSFDFGYYHFFEKSRLISPRHYPEHIPKKDMFIGNLKVGFLF